MLRNPPPHSCRSHRAAHSHFVQLFIHIFIVFIVLAKLSDQSPIGQGEELRALKEIQQAVRTKSWKRKVGESRDWPQCNCQGSKAGNLCLVRENIIPYGVIQEFSFPGSTWQGCSQTHYKTDVKTPHALSSHSSNTLRGASANPDPTTAAKPKLKPPESGAGALTVH